MTNRKEHYQKVAELEEKYPEEMKAFKKLLEEGTEDEVNTIASMANIQTWRF